MEAKVQAINTHLIAIMVADSHDFLHLNFQRSILLISVNIVGYLLSATMVLFGRINAPLLVGFIALLHLNNDNGDQEYVLQLQARQL